MISDVLRILILEHTESLRSPQCLNWVSSCKYELLSNQQLQLSYFTNESNISPPLSKRHERLSRTGITLPY